MSGIDACRFFDRIYAAMLRDGPAGVEAVLAEYKAALAEMEEQQPSEEGAP